MKDGVGLRAATFILVLLLALGVACGTNTHRAYAAGPTASILSEDNLSANAGSTVVVPINISGNPGIMGMGLTVGYDSDVLTPVSVESASLTSEGQFDDSIEASSAGSFSIEWAHSENITGNGTLFNVTFQVSEYAEGDTTVSLGFIKKDTFNEDFDDVTLACSPAVISISSTSPTSTTVRGGANLSANDGSEIEIPILIDNMSGVESLDFALSYDTAVFTYESVAAGVGATCEVTASEDGCSVGVSGIDTETASGTLLTLKFKVADYAGGNYVFGLTSSDVSTRDFRVKIINTHSNENAIVTGGAVELSGTELTIPVRITNNHGIAGFRFTMTYDGAALEPVSVTKSGALTGSLNNTIGDAIGSFDVLWTGTDNYYENGVLYTAKFNVLSSADASTIIRMQYSPADTCDEEGKDVLLTMSDIEVELAPAPAPALESISASKATTAYTVGDELDVSDVTVIATYSDGSSKAVEGWTSDAASIDMSTAGTKSITISYAESDISVTCAISIIVEAVPEPEVVLSSISAVKAKTDYQVNDELGIDDVVVTASYSDGTSKTVEGWQIDVASVDMSTVGTKALVITYTEGKVTVACSVSVNVEAPSVVRTLSHILATKAKTAYTVGDELAVDDVIVTAAYSDGSTVQVTGWTSDEATIDMTSVGTKVLTIAYTEDGISVNCTISITVSAPPEAETTLMSISASKEKTVYTMGDDLSVDDVVVTAVYSDGSSKTVTDWVSNVETVDMSTAGVKSIAIAYTEREITVICAVTISVEAAPQPDPLLTSISASKGKAAYRVGDALNVDDIIVTATYSDGSSKAVEGWQSDVASIDMATEGAKTLTIIYIEGDIARTCTIEITVKEDGQEEAGLAYIHAEQNEVTLFVGDELDLSGVKIMACYFNRDDDVQISLEDCVVDASEVDMSEPGCYFVEVTYAEGGVSDCVYITVNVRTDIKAFDAKVKIDTTNSDMYLFGLPAMPKVSIDGLTEGEDYEVSYSDNTNAGEGKVIITGLEPYGGTIVKSFTIAPAHVFLMVPGIKQSSAVYTGKAHKPHVTFAFPGLVQERDYKLTYKNNVNIGEASVVVTGLGNYAGNYELYFDILPAKAAIGKAKSEKAKTIKVVPKKQPGGVKYQVGYRLGKKGVWKYKTIKKKSITLKKLKKRKKYQVRIRAFKKVGGEAYYGAWSKIKNVKVR